MNTENIIPVNNEALSRALVATVGEETAAVIVKAYKEIDQAMAAGFAQGFKAAQDQLGAAVNAQADEAFEKGCKQGDEDQWEAGYAKGFNEGCDQQPHSYDDGYIDGVSDARAFPADADARVAELCADDEYAEYDFEDYDFHDWDTDMAEQLAKTPVIPESDWRDQFDPLHEDFVAQRENDLRMAQLAY